MLFDNFELYHFIREEKLEKNGNYANGRDQIVTTTQ